MRAAHLRNSERKCEVRVRALIILVVKQHLHRACGAEIHTHSAYESTSRAHPAARACALAVCPALGLAAQRVRRIRRTLADGTLFWVVLTDSEKDLRWLGSRGCPVRLAPSGLRALKAVTDRVRSRSRDNVSRRAVTSYPDSTGSRTRRD